MSLLCPDTGSHSEQHSKLVCILGCWRFWALAMIIIGICWFCETCWFRNTFLPFVKRHLSIRTSYRRQNISATALEASIASSSVASKALSPPPPPSSLSSSASSFVSTLKQAITTPTRDVFSVTKDDGSDTVSATSSSDTSLPITTLMVCSKCVRRDLPEACTMAASCRASASASTPLLGDMEDLIGGGTTLANPSLMSARDIKSTALAMSQEGDNASSIQIKTGRKLYHRLRARRLDKLSTKETTDDALIQQQHQLRIIPVDCLSNCDRGNCIAITAPGKYTYQFGDLDERRPEVLDDIMRFTTNYMESTDGFSKTKTRPTWMKSNVLARIPPLPIPSNLLPNWYNMEQEDTLEANEIQRRQEEQKEKEQQEQMVASLLNNTNTNNNNSTSDEQHDTTATSLVHRHHHHHHHNHHHDQHQHSYTTSSSVNGLFEEREPCDCRQSFV